MGGCSLKILVIYSDDPLKSLHAWIISGWLCVFLVGSCVTSWFHHGDDVSEIFRRHNYSKNAGWLIKLIFPFVSFGATFMPSSVTCIAYLVIVVVIALCSWRITHRRDD